MNFTYVNCRSVKLSIFPSIIQPQAQSVWKFELKNASANLRKGALVL